MRTTPITVFTRLRGLTLALRLLLAPLLGLAATPHGRLGRLHDQWQPGDLHLQLHRCARNLDGTRQRNSGHRRGIRCPGRRYLGCKRLLT